MAKIDNYVVSAQSDMFVIGLPLKTDYGFVRQIKVKEYPTMLIELEILKMADWELKSMIKKQIKQIKGGIVADSVLSDLSTKPLINCIQLNTAGLRTKYGEVFSKFMIDYEGDKFFERFKTQSDFDSFRNAVLDFNGIDRVEWNPNPELRRFQRLEQHFNKMSGRSVDFDAMFTSLMAIGHKPHDINDFTLYQFNSAFKRLQMFKMYDTTTLYKTVDAKGRIEIIEWFKTTKDKDNEKSEIEYDSLEAIQDVKNKLSK
jgi:hypothetical protein